MFPVILVQETVDVILERFVVHSSAGPMDINKQRIVHHPLKPKVELTPGIFIDPFSTVEKVGSLENPIQDIQVIADSQLLAGEAGPR